MRGGLATAMLVPCLVTGTPAFAQVGETLLSQPAIPGGFNRDRNISVSERPRRDFDPLGIRVRSFLVLPSVELGVGGTSNTYRTANNANAGPLAYVAPSISATSLWSRHQLQFRAAGRFVRYPGEKPRDEDTWNVGLSGRADLGVYNNVTANLLASRSVEDFFSGDVATTIAALSRYDTYTGAVRGTYAAGRTRLIGSVDHSVVRYSDIRLLDGGLRDQSGRDRSVTRVTGQIDFARTPSVSVFGQIGYARTAFPRPLAAGLAERDSNGYRALGGLNFDIAGRARGSIGVGYTYRDFDAAAFENVSGLSVEARLELFPSELSTYTITARRAIEDSALGLGVPYFDNRLTVRVDREVRRNLIVNAQASYAKQEYQGAIANADGYQVGAGARYLSTRRFRLDATVTYSDRSTQGITTGNRVSEIRGQFGIVLQR